MLRAPALPVLILLTLPLAAGATGFTPPDGCTLHMTVQTRGCVVANYYTCDSDAAGDRRTVFADKDGIFSLTRIHAETRWMETYSPVDGITDRLVPEAHAHASFTRLIETGRDDYDFAIVDSTGEVRRYRGHDRLTGETRRIDGRLLEVTESAVQVDSGTGEPLYARRGQQFIDRAQRLFFGGQETLEVPGSAPEVSNEGPVYFALPGEPGFAASTPEYDCDVLMTAAPPGRAG